MIGRNLLKRVGIGLLAVACVTLAGYEYFGVAAPQRDEMRTLDAEMDHVQSQMKTWGGADWSPRQYGVRRVSQAWFVKVAGLSDAELAKRVYDLGGYDASTGGKGKLRMDVGISSAPSSEWRIARVEIRVE